MNAAVSTFEHLDEARLPARLRGTVTVSVDIEDWHQLVTRRLSGRLPECSTNVETQTRRVLEILDAHSVRGTFFVLGLVARAKPHLVTEIAKRGHEVASHGVSHIPLHLLDRAAVREELTASRKLLSDLAGEDVVGFRAPEFSITERNAWVLDEIVAAGYRYDSSIFPILHRRYGIKNFARGPVRVPLSSGALWELPLGTLPSPAGNLPIAGGGYFRLLPGVVLERAIQVLGARGDYTMLYFHPYEFTRSRLALSRDAMPTRLRERARARVWLALQALGQQRLPPRVERVLRAAQTVRCVDLIDALENAKSPRSEGFVGSHAEN
jgi:polysaccharide deacetylase family protein (PEP-CTERM system associated)